MGKVDASLPICIALLVLLGVHHHATTTRQTDAIARLQASYARLQTTYAALAAACAEPRQHAHAPAKHGCGPFAGCVDRVAAAGDAVASRRRSKGAFATFGAASCMNGLFGMVLLPVLAHVPRPKILEIGLGCGMPDGPGESADVWHELFPRGLDLWVAEYDAPCVAAYEASPLKHNATRVLVGDQGKADDLRRWARDAGGAFDAVIDDGGHRNSLLLASFRELWRHVRDGGVYFMEDLSMGRVAAFDDTNGGAVMSDVMASWIDQLLITTKWDEAYWGPQPTFDAETRRRFPLPDDVAFISCGPNACALGKSRTPGITRPFPGLRLDFRSGY